MEDYKKIANLALEIQIMMKKMLFLVFHGFDANNGISKKIMYQVDVLKSCGIETNYCFMDETNSKKRLVDRNVIADYGNEVKSKIFKRIVFSSIVKYVIANCIEFVYLRSNQ